MKKINSRVSTSKEVRYELDAADVQDALKAYTRTAKAENVSVNVAADGSAVVIATVSKVSTPKDE